MLAVAWMQLVRLSRGGDGLRWRYTLLTVVECLTVGLFLLADQSHDDPGALPRWRRLGSERMSALLGWLLWQQAAAALLMGPALAAGGVASERKAGTLEHLLIAPLSDFEIVLGKWLAFTALTLDAVLPGVLGCAILAGLADAPPAEAAARVLAPLLVAPLGVAVALMASAFVREPASALAAAYTLGAALLAAGWPGRALGVWALAGLVPVLVCLLVAASALRPMHARLAEARPRRRLFEPLPVRENPFRWREAWFGGLPVIGRTPTWLGMLAVAGLTTALHALVHQSLSGVWRDEALVVCGLSGVLLLAALALVRGAVAITGERERGTWPLALLTPVETNDLLRQKHQGVVAGYLPLLSAHFFMALPWACRAGDSATWTLFGLAVLACPLVSAAAAIGLNGSARLDGSWQAIAQCIVEALLFLAALAYALCVALVFAAAFYLYSIQPDDLPRLAAGGYFGPLRLPYLILLAIVVALVGRWQTSLAAEWIDANERTPRPEQGA